jgi:hypothetical protein
MDGRRVGFPSPIYHKFVMAVFDNQTMKNMQLTFVIILLPRTLPAAGFQEQFQTK